MDSSFNVHGKNTMELPLNLALEKDASGRIIYALLEYGFARKLPELALCNISACLVGFCASWESLLQNDSKHTAPSDNRIYLPSPSDVVQDIIHDEPAAQRDEELLQQQEDHAWSDAVERRIHAPQEPAVHLGDNAATNEALPESVFILRYKHGDSQRFRSELLQGSELRVCRETMSGQGQSCEHRSGALIFVQPWQYRDVIEALSSISGGPYAYHIVVSKSLQYLIDLVLGTFSYRTRPRDRETRVLLQNSSRAATTSSANGSDDNSIAADGESATVHTSEDESDGPVGTIVVARTFLCIAPIRREANTVAQSTTEAYHDQASISHYNYFRGYNPRRSV
eukprot:TRINITY_DN11209_c0_g1_i1.p1 TRINITY_DN11209_c0_g1~~TRINITY_DN11209_c0_g1_i1.p1  ORF type:complete len:340 (-),score=43.49 TRINITY_DN11209_c0_g1_i1:410-1429(-)